MKRSSKDLKQLAREILQGKYGTFIGTYVIMSLITSAFVFIPALLYQGNSMSAFVVRQIISYIVSLVITVLDVGMLQLSLNASRGKTFSVADLFHGFRHHPDRIIVAAFLCLLMNLFYTIPYSLLLRYTSSYAFFQNNLSLVAGTALAALCGFIISYIILLPFQMVYFLLLDNDELGALEALSTSMRLMKGNKGRYFYMELSFIGLSLLGVLSFGIGMLWVAPYINVTTTQFYRDLNGELDAPGINNTVQDNPYQYRSYPTDLY